jgi:hypothetical protein
MKMPELYKEMPEILLKDIMDIPTEPTTIDESLLKDLLAVSLDGFNSGKVLVQMDTCISGQNVSVFV